jgi:hypothetical protein
MAEGGSKISGQVMAESPVKSIPEINQAVVETPVEATIMAKIDTTPEVIDPSPAKEVEPVVTVAPQQPAPQFVQAEREDAFKDAIENTHPINVVEATASSDKISTSKKRRMKKKAAKAAKGGQTIENGQAAEHDEEDDVSDVSPLAETAKKEFVEVVSANQSYEAYYSADSESQADIVGRHMRR